MAKVRGLLLRSPNGAYYFIEGGIKAHKIADTDEADRFLESVHEDFRTLVDDLHPGDAQDHAENSSSGRGTLTSNSEPVPFVAFNVWVEVADAGDVVTAGSSTNYSGF